MHYVTVRSAKLGRNTRKRANTFASVYPDNQLLEGIFRIALNQVLQAFPCICHIFRRPILYVSCLFLWGLQLQLPFHKSKSTKGYEQESCQNIAFVFPLRILYYSNPNKKGALKAPSIFSSVLLLPVSAVHSEG
jgi:hypothetical protein